MTITTISMATLYIIGHFPYSIYYIMHFAFNMHLEWLNILAEAFLNLPIILKLGVYYFYDDVFRSELDSCIANNRLVRCCTKNGSESFVPVYVDTSAEITHV
jgi:hypothetical protein